MKEKPKIGAREIVLALALAAIIHMPITWLSEGLDSAQIQLIIFAFTYALLAAIEILGGGNIPEKDNTFLEEI